MRSEWVPLSASALVIGAMSLVFGAILSPMQSGASGAETLRIVDEDGARWLAMAVMFLLASVALVLGLPSVLTLFSRRGRRLGLAGASLFVVASIGLWGFAMMMVLFRAMVTADAVLPGALQRATSDLGLSTMLWGWLGAFYGGVVLIAVALLVAGSAPRWVPVLLIAWVASTPFAAELGKVGGAVQVMALGVALTGVAVAAVAGNQKPALGAQPAF